MDIEQLLNLLRTQKAECNAAGDDAAEDGSPNSAACWYARANGIQDAIDTIETENV